MSDLLQQRAYQHLRELITNAEMLAANDPENEEQLREAQEQGEDLLDELDNVEHDLIEAIREAQVFDQ